MSWANIMTAPKASLLPKDLAGRGIKFTPKEMEDRIEHVVRTRRQPPGAAMAMTFSNGSFGSTSIGLDQALQALNGAPGLYSSALISGSGSGSGSLEPRIG